MIYCGTPEQLQEYEASDRINQSMLKMLLKGVDAFNAAMNERKSEEEIEEENQVYKEKEQRHFIIGHAAERLAQYGEEEFAWKYHISKVAKPSDTVMSIITQLFDGVKAELEGQNQVWPQLSDIKTDLLDCINSHSYQPRWGDDAKLNAVIKAGEVYYDDLIQSNGKQILSSEEASISEAISVSWSNHPRTKQYFKPEDGTDIYYQLPIYFHYEGVPAKALLDVLAVDHINKTFGVKDLKTMFDYPINFPYQVMKLRYDIQAEWYLSAAISWAKENLPPDYTAVMPEFIVETTKPFKQGNPLVFRASGELLNIARYGRTLVVATDHYPGMIPESRVQSEMIYKDIKGIRALLYRYEYHCNNGFHADMEVMMAGENPITLNWGGR